MSLRMAKLTGILGLCALVFAIGLGVRAKARAIPMRFNP